MVFIEGNICFFFKVIVLSICGCNFEMCNSFGVIFVIDVDKIVVFGIGMDELF